MGWRRRCRGLGSDARLPVVAASGARQQAALDAGEEPLGEQGDDRDDDHRGVDAGGVEGALGVGDQQAEALVGAGVLADDRADQGEAEGDVQAGEDPGGGAGQDDRASASAGAVAPRIRALSTEVPVDLAGALEGVEEDGEEDQDDGGGDLELMPEAEPDDEQRRQHDARDGVGGLDERRAARRPGSGCGRAAMPKTTPSDEPMRKPMTASCRVTRICCQIEPCAVPVGEPVDELVARSAIGLEKIERVDPRGVATSSQLPSQSDDEQHAGGEHAQRTGAGGAVRPAERRPARRRPGPSTGAVGDGHRGGRLGAVDVRRHARASPCVRGSARPLRAGTPRSPGRSR